MDEEEATGEECGVVIGNFLDAGVPVVGEAGVMAIGEVVLAVDKCDFRVIPSVVCKVLTVSVLSSFLIVGVLVEIFAIMKGDEAFELERCAVVSAPLLVLSAAEADDVT